MLLINPNFTGTCIIDNSGVYSFDQLINKVNNYDVDLGNRINKNDRVLIFSDYSFNCIALLIYLSKFPINIVPIVKTTEEELEDKFSSIKPNLFLSFSISGELIIKKYEIISLDVDGINRVTELGDTGIILFSSGTTGKPKMMIQNFSELIRSIRIPRKQKRLVFLLMLMFDHIGGLNTLLNCLINGNAFVIPKDRNPTTILELIDEFGVNVLPTTPTFLNLLLMDESFSVYRLDSLKLITYGTERMSDVLLNKLVHCLPQVKLLQTFGTSETGILKTESKSSSSLFFKIIDEDSEFKILNNELFLKSKTSVNGYLNYATNDFKENGWYATGDIVEVDEEGYIKVIGRKNKIINVGGLKVLPSEVEDVINSIEDVIESSVFGEQNQLVGNIVCVKVYTNSKNLTELKTKIKAKCKNQLDKYKVPVKIYFESLSMNARGKKNV
jgi:acyl-coenzyme A synthetase/AMP-(fatty) acid ligase